VKKQINLRHLLQQKKIVKANLLIDLISVLPVIVIAILSNSLVLAADISDFALTISGSSFALIVLKRCIKNERGNYDFGLGKLESLSALIVSFLMIVGLSLLGYEAYKRLFEVVKLDSTFVFIGILINTIAFVINSLLWFNSYKISKEFLSPIMEAQWRVNRINAIGNIIVITSLVSGLILYDYKWAHFIDPSTAFLLIIITGKSFFELIKNSVEDLLDHTLSEGLQMKILKRLTDYEGSYERFYDVRSRKSGSKIFIDISLGFDPARKIGEALALSSALKEKLELDIPACEVNVIIRSLEEFDETLINVDLPGTISPLTQEHLELCLDMLKTSFPLDDMEEIKLELLTSINPLRYSEELKNRYSLEHPRYWVILLGEKIKGICGIYYVAGEPDTVWLGWMTTLNDLPRSEYKIKMHLIWKVAYECRLTGRKYARAISSDLPSESAVYRLHENLGLKIYKTEPGEDCTMLYRQGVVADIYERIRPGKKRRIKPKNN